MLLVRMYSSLSAFPPNNPNECPWFVQELVSSGVLELILWDCWPVHHVTAHTIHNMPMRIALQTQVGEEFP